MRDLFRNHQTVYYALYDGMDEILDSDGNSTGEYEIKYKPIVKEYLNISAARGTADVEQFGINVPYSRTVITTDMSTPWKEDTIFWLDQKGILPFTPRSAHRVHDKCVYDGKLYECISEYSGTFDDEKWKPIPHNYVVASIARGLDSIMLGLREVSPT